MSIHKRTATRVVARQLRNYKAGDRVRVLRGKYGGQEMVVRASENAWVRLEGTPSRVIMSKGNVEPSGDFTEEELNQARRAAEKMVGLGSLI